MPKMNSSSRSTSKSRENNKPPVKNPIGFYKRRRGVFEHIEAGTIDLLENGIHDYLSLRANLVLGGSSSIPAGVCFISAPALLPYCKRWVHSGRTMQRIIDHMEQIGWIKTWPKNRGNYPTLICRATVHDLSGNEYRVNGEQTTDWRHPVYELVGQLSTSCPQVVRNLASRREVEVREQNKEEREVNHDGQTDSFSLTGMVWEELKISSLPVSFRGFAELVAENPLGDAGNLVPWGQRILDLCAERSTEYPKVFLKRIKDRERSGKSIQASNPVHRNTGNLEVHYA